MDRKSAMRERRSAREEGCLSLDSAWDNVRHHSSRGALRFRHELVSSKVPRPVFEPESTRSSAGRAATQPVYAYCGEHGYNFSKLNQMYTTRS